MELFKVIRCNGIEYTLENARTTTNIFISIFSKNKNIQLEKDDEIIIHQNLIDTSSNFFIGSYTFGDMDSFAGKDNVTNESTEFFAIKKPNGTIFELKRIYG